MIRTRMALGRLAAAACLALVLCVASITGAAADVLDAVASTSSVIDFQPLLIEVVNTAIMIGAPAIGALLLWLLFRVQRWIGIRATVEQEFELRAKVDQAMFHAAAYARQRAAAAGPLNVDVGSADVAAGARYAMNAIPDTLKKLGITDASSQRLKDMVEARLGAPAA